MGEKANVVGGFVSGGGGDGEGVDDLGVDEAGVGLACGGIEVRRQRKEVRDALTVGFALTPNPSPRGRGGKERREFFDDELIEAVDLLGVVVEECEEGGLGSGGAFQAAKAQAVEASFDFFEGKDKVVGPEGGAFADGGGLGGLEVGEAEGWQIAVFGGEGCESIDDARELLSDETERLADLDEVGVADDVLGGGSEVNDGAGGWGGVTKGMDVGHDVVAELGFVTGGGVEVDVVEVIADVGDLVLGDVEAEFALGLGEGEPEAAPEGVPCLG